MFGIGYELLNRHRPGILVRRDLHHRIIRVHLDRACRLGDALCIPPGSEARRLDDEPLHRLLGPWQIGSLIDPFECARR